MELNQSVQFNTSVSTCGADFIGVCDDAECASYITNDHVTLLTNPSYLDRTTNSKPAPVIIVDATQDVELPVYIMGNSNRYYNP